MAIGSCLVVCCLDAPLGVHTPALLPPWPDESRLNLYKVTEERDRLKKEKEEQYQSLMRKMKEVEMAYEAILQVSSLLCVLGPELCCWFVAQ